MKPLKAKDVKASVQGDNDDGYDAVWLAEAGTRRHLRPLPINTLAQQDLQSLHRVRELLIKERTALVNQARRLLAEYSVVVARGLGVFRRQVPRVREDAENGLTERFREIRAEMYERVGMFTVVGPKKNRGNRYLRTLLMHGARSVVRYAKGKIDPRSRWINRIVGRGGANVATVANKNARIAWTLLRRGESHQPTLRARC